MQRLPVGFLQQVIEYRAYAAAHAANEADPTGSSRSPMRTLAMTIAYELAAEEIARRG